MKKIIFFLFLSVCQLKAYSQDIFVPDSLTVLYESAENDSVKIDVLLKLSRFYQTNDFKKSLEYANTALEIAQETDYPLLEAKTYNKLGILLFRIGRYDASLEHFLESKKIYEKIGESNNLIGLVHNIGGVYFQIKEYDKAEECYDYVLTRQKELFEQGDSTNLLKMHVFYNSMGLLHDEKKEYQKAKNYFKKALENVQELNLYEEIGGIYNNMGEISLTLKDTVEALHYWNLAVENCNKFNDKGELIRSYLSLANYFIGVKNYSKAKDLASIVFTEAENIGALQSMGDASFLLFNIYKELGEPNKALDAHIKYHNYHDSLYSERSGKEITRLQMSYEFDKKEEVRRVEMNKLKFKNGLIISTLVFGIIVIGLLFLLNKTRAQSLYYEKKSLENELELGNKELTMNVIYLLEKNELMKDILTRLSDIKFEQNEKNKDIIHQMIRDVESNMAMNIWKEFEIRFQKVHNGFYTTLREKFPNLSNAEERLAALLSLGMSSKEIASITHQSIKSIEVARTRLRKKMNLTNTDTNLVTFLSKI